MTQQDENSAIRPRLPQRLKVRAPGSPQYIKLKGLMRGQSLHTVCEEAHCPNIGECWNSGTATFMLMGDSCTRGCRFCAVNSARFPAPLNEREPDKLADTISTMNLRYAVLTTVDRDDLLDQGAEHIARCIQTVQRRCPDLLIEILMPDFCGKTGLLRKVIDSGPAVLRKGVIAVISGQAFHAVPPAHQVVAALGDKRTVALAPTLVLPEQRLDGLVGRLVVGKNGDQHLHHPLHKRGSVGRL